jgi:hypothetical protein
VGFYRRSTKEIYWENIEERVPGDLSLLRGGTCYQWG